MGSRQNLRAFVTSVASAAINEFQSGDPDLFM